MKKNPSPKISPLIKETYLAAVRNSTGSRLFRNLYAKVNGKKTDILKGGELSCAFFVSALVSLLGLCKRIHSTVDGAVLDLKESGWSEIAQPRVGSIVVWEPLHFEGEEHRHIGFYVGNHKAISNSSTKKTPARHDLTYDGKRKVIQILWNNKLE
jgi:hypothetical protein